MSLRGVRVGRVLLLLLDGVGCSSGLPPFLGDGCLLVFDVLLVTVGGKG